MYIPSGNLASLLNMATEIVSVPIKHGDLNHSYVNDCQRVNDGYCCGPGKKKNIAHLEITPGNYRTGISIKYEL